MTKSITAVSLAMFATLAAPAFAQESNAAIDTNADGVYNLEELQAAFPQVPEEVLTAIDTNEDGIVDVAELTYAQNTGLIGS